MTPTRPQRVAALAVGTIALLMIGLQPLLLGELVERRELTLEGVGIVAMGEIVAVGLGVIAGDLLLPLARLRSIALLAAVATAACNLATLHASGDAGFTAIRAAAGFAEGVLVWVATGVIVRTALPDRLAGIFLVVQTLGQAVVAALLALAVVPRAGWAGGFGVLAALSLLAALPALRLPAGLEPLAMGRAAQPRWGRAAALALGVAFLQLAAIGALWAYLEPLGRASGLGVQAAQTLVSAVLVMQVVGGSVAAVLVRRLGAPVTLAAGALLLGAIALAIGLGPAPAPWRFALLCAGFGFVWLFLMPFHIRLAFEADPRGQVAVLVPAAQLIGSAFGPLVASLLVAGDDAGPVPFVSAAFAAGAAAALAAFRARRAGATEPLAARPRG